MKRENTDKYAFKPRYREYVFSKLGGLIMIRVHSWLPVGTRRIGKARDVWECAKWMAHGHGTSSMICRIESDEDFGTDVIVRG